MAESRDSSKDEECPSLSFKRGEPQGECWGDGHYECKNCVFYRRDFFKNGQDYIDFVHNLQGRIQLIVAK